MNNASLHFGGKMANFTPRNGVAKLADISVFDKTAPFDQTLRSNYTNNYQFFQYLRAQQDR